MVGLRPNGVVLRIPGVAVGTRVVGEVCSPLKCTSGTARYDNDFLLQIDNPGISSTTSLDVTVTVRTAAGRVIVPTTRLRVTPTRGEPHGSHCEPTGYFATAVVSPPSAAPKAK